MSITSTLSHLNIVCRNMLILTEMHVSLNFNKLARTCTGHTCSPSARGKHRPCPAPPGLNLICACALTFSYYLFLTLQTDRWNSLVKFCILPLYRDVEQSLFSDHLTVVLRLPCCRSLEKEDRKDHLVIGRMKYLFSNVWNFFNLFNMSETKIMRENQNVLHFNQTSPVDDSTEIHQQLLTYN